MRLLITLSLLIASAASADETIAWSRFRSVILLRSLRGDSVYFCGSVAIAPRVLLTAAHCLDGATRTQAFPNSPFDPASQDFLVAQESRIHPDYDRAVSLFESDLGLVRLPKDLPPGVELMKLSDSSAPSPGARVERIGLGATGPSGISMRWTNPVVAALSVDGGVLTLDDEYPYPGDSGGPIFLRTPEALELIAVHSTYDPNSGQTHDPYLAHYRAWIDSVIASWE
jgi:hypothetical protein